jgi:hypothetical protein
MLSAHLDLITQTTKRARELERDFDTAAKALSRLVERPPNPERTAELEELVEKLESYADNWEDLQRSHNDSLEGLDEDFLDRFAEIELDVELPPKQQEQFDTRMNDLLSLLDRLEVQISEQGALAMRELSRAGSRFGSMAERAGAGWFFFLLFAGLGGSGGWILSRTDFSWEELLILTPVAVLGSFALSLAVRKR